MNTYLLASACICGLLFAPEGSPINQDEPVEMGQYRQLFVDDHVIAEMHGVTRVLNQPKKHPANPLLKPELPWEGIEVRIYGAVVYDQAEKVFKMWYTGYDTAEGHRGLYATSKDGIHWDKPQLGLVNYEGSKANNRIPWFGMGVIHSPDESDPARRYKTLAGRRGAGASDGVRFQALPGSQNIPGDLAGDNVIPFCYDELGKRHIAFPKVVRTSRGWKRRSVSLAQSKNFLTWTKAEAVLVPDARDDELARERVMARIDRVAYDDGPDWHLAQFYGMAGFPYEGMYLGMLWVLDISGWPEGKQRVPSIGGEDGVIQVELTSSRDLLHWQRVADRDLFIPVGQAGTWEAARIYTANRPLIVGDQIWIYYSGGQVSKSHPFRNGKAEVQGDAAGVGLATLRLDGWVSMDAGSEEGALTTRPLVFEGKKKLLINAQAAEGSVAVEILDRAGKPLPNFAKSDCATFSGDSIRHTVDWNGQADLSRLAGKPVRLRFYLQDAKLFSFTVAEVPGLPAP